MHYGRVIAVIGYVLAIIGLGLKSVSSTAEYILPGLRSINPAFPDSFDRVLVSLWNESAPAAGVFVIALVTVLGLSLTPAVKRAMSRKKSIVVTVFGVVMLAIGVVATLGAMESVDSLVAGFARVAAAGLINEGHTAAVGVGWYLMIVAGALVAIGGVLQLFARKPASDAPADT